MRRTLALACCALALVFGFVAGKAHVHGLPDHHEESRGLHVAHTHLGHADHHDTAEHSGHGGDEDPHIDDRLPGHHDDDALYLTVTTRRPMDPGLRVMTADFAPGDMFEVPASVSLLIEQVADPLREPPAARPARPRAPPA